MYLTVRAHQLSFSPHKTENLKRILHLIAESEADLDVFPEYGMGFLPNGLTREFIQENAEPLEGEFVTEILDQTSNTNSAAVFTTFLLEDEVVSNAAILAMNGQVKKVYRKIHLFDAFGYKESTLFVPGKELVTTNIQGFNVGLALCFDLRFPELFRAMAYKGVNLFIVPSGWYRGTNKLQQWRTLTVARAHENISYLVAVNQTAPFFIGHTMITSPLACILKELDEKQASFTVKLDYNEIEEAKNLVPTISLSKPALYQKFLANHSTFNSK